jgi:phosphate transport system permease protein
MRFLSRKIRDKSSLFWMVISLVILLLMPILLAVGLYLKSLPILQEQSFWDLLTESDWKPMQGKFGFLPFITSSLWVTFLSIIIATPVCILTAIYLTQYAKKRVLAIMQPIIDILAGLPSVIYGVWGVLIVVPFISKTVAPFFGLQTSGYTILAGAIVLSIMVIPFILNILIEVFRTIPEELTEASLSVGATKWETIKYVLLKKAFPGIISATGLGVARAFGETIAVLMVVGNVVKVPTSVFDSGYPLPALIANNYGEMLSIPMYDSALMLAALILFGIVLLFNFLSRMAIIRSEKNQ